MTYIVANTANTNTFDYQRNRINELAYVATNLAVTTNSNTAVGNAGVTGKFSANTIAVGNSTVNLSISSPNSVQISGGGYFLNSNGAWSTFTVTTFSGSTNTSGTSAQEVDNYAMGALNGVEYFIAVKDNTSNNRLITKLLTTHDNVTAYSTEFGTINTGSSLGTFTVSSNTTHIRILFTPTSTNTSVGFSRTSA